MKSDLQQANYRYIWQGLAVNYFVCINSHTNMRKMNKLALPQPYTNYLKRHFSYKGCCVV